MTPLIWSALALIITAALALRFTGLDREGRWGDEYRQTRSYTLPPRYVVAAARTAGQPPLDYLIGWALAKVELSDRMRRVPAAFFGVAGVAALFVLLRRLASARGGLIAAAFLALSPLHWALSQDARPYTIATAALLVTLWALARSLDRPESARLILYGVACYVFTLTRGLLPLVILLAIGLTLSALWLFHGRRWPASSGQTLAALRRAWMVTVLVGMIATPMVLYLITGAGHTVYTESGRGFGAALSLTPLARMASNAVRWLPLPGAMFGGAFPFVIGLAAVGAVLCVRRRHALPLGTQCVLLVMAFAGPLYLLTFSASVPVSPIRLRYGLFLTPIVALFAAMALSDGLRWLRDAAPTRAYGRLGAALVTLILLAGPAATTLALFGKFFRPDWRGCAAYLADTVAAEDVVMVYQDQPVSQSWMTFWGKYDWPADMQRPLAEPVRSLAQSESHWQRLCRQSGRCVIVIRYQVGAETRDEYLLHGLREAPGNMRLTKFRGLDVLERLRPAGDANRRMIDACNDMLALPREHPDGTAFLYALRSRLQLRTGDVVAAVESFDRAKGAVPAGLRGWFVGELGVHAAALAQADTVVESMRRIPSDSVVTQRESSHEWASSDASTSSTEKVGPIATDRLMGPK